MAYADSYEADLAEMLMMEELPMEMEIPDEIPDPDWKSFSQQSAVPGGAKVAETGTKTVFEAWRTYGDVGDKARAPEARHGMAQPGGPGMAVVPSASAVGGKGHRRLPSVPSGGIDHANDLGLDR